MTRREFLKMLGALGLASQLPPPVFERLERLAEAEPEAPVKPLVTVNELDVEAESITVTQGIEDLGAFSWDPRMHYLMATPFHEVEVTTMKPLAIDFNAAYILRVRPPDDGFYLEMEGRLKEMWLDFCSAYDDEGRPMEIGRYRYLFGAVNPSTVMVTEKAGLEWL